MRDFALYQAVLELQAPWSVVNVELDVKGQQVTVAVEAGPGPYPCPECRELVPGDWSQVDTPLLLYFSLADVI